MFFAAISRVSFFGFLYLLLCFVLLYRGQDMLVDRQSQRIKRFTDIIMYVHFKPVSAVIEAVQLTSAVNIKCI